MKYKILILCLFLFACEKEVIQPPSPTPPDIWAGTVEASGNFAQIVNFTAKQPDAVLVTPISEAQIITVVSADSGVIRFRGTNPDGTPTQRMNFYYQITINTK